LISANLDLILASNTLTVLTNDGSGRFVLSSSPKVGNIPAAVAAVDVNRDDKIDFDQREFK